MLIRFVFTVAEISRHGDHCAVVQRDVGGQISAARQQLHRLLRKFLCGWSDIAAMRSQNQHKVKESNPHFRGFNETDFNSKRRGTGGAQLGSKVIEQEQNHRYYRLRNIYDKTDRLECDGSFVVRPVFTRCTS